MKLRLRYQKATKVLTIPEDVQTFYTLADVRGAALELFENTLSGFTPFAFSLNRTDVLDDESKVLSEYDIVTGDLIYILNDTDNVPTQFRNAENVKTQPVIQSDCASTSLSSTSVSSVGEKVTSENSDCGTCKSVNSGVDSGSQSDPVESSSQQDAGASAVSNRNQAQPTSEMETNMAATANTSNTDGVLDNETIDVEEEFVDLSTVKQFLSEPSLCREVTGSAVPALLQEVYTSLQPANKTEALCAVLHVMMLETGFTLKTEADVASSSSSTTQIVPERWKFTGVVRFLYTYPGCNDVSCSLSLISAGPQLVCHGKVTGEENVQTQQLSLKPAEYVTSLAPDAGSTYCNLARLSMVFKDTVVLPLLQDIRLCAGLHDAFGLLALTQEIKLRVFSCLDVASTVRLSEVNRELLVISRDPYLWRRHYLKEFGKRSDNSLSQDWRELYISRYKERKERRKQMSRMTMVAPRIGVHPGYPFGGPLMPPGPGMIGGDYDLFPSYPYFVPGAPHNFGGSVPRPRVDLIGPYPDQGFMARPGSRNGYRGGRGGGGRGSPFGGGFGPRFF